MAIKALETVPSQFVLYDREGNPKVNYGGDAVHFDPGSSGLHVLDPDTVITSYSIHYTKLYDALTDLGDDIFFLTLDEMLELLSGERLASDLIASRKEIYQRHKALPSYPSVIRGQFDPYKWANDPNRRNDIYDHNTSLSTQISDTIKGAAGSAGRVEGLARVMTGPEESDLFHLV